ncbi:hypothetical protein L596_019280 [Steinernema carpocapsae]|uniref:Uncharacterized protein n=1 Tax=Steinernema carpocapsae TaxID=34508 RepID=A0A4U5MQ30_STECR|nr:hypothetical protein L596_019280 [Steinernema carpocapsae]
MQTGSKKLNSQVNDTKCPPPIGLKFGTRVNKLISVVDFWKELFFKQRNGMERECFHALHCTLTHDLIYTSGRTFFGGSICSV